MVAAQERPRGQAEGSIGHSRCGPSLRPRQALVLMPVKVDALLPRAGASRERGVSRGGFH